MPVSTRSQISSRKSIELRQSPDRCKSFLQNPHQDLKEKMKSLTLLYEQQKQALALRHHPSIDLLDSSRSTIGGDNQKEVMKNKDPNCFLKMEAKENKEPGISDRFAAYSMPRNVAAAAGAKLRRASMGSVQDGKGLGSKIMVFVRLRPMGKKGEETGSRTCVKIVNKRDVYLTEFASEKDYLRLKRVRGRHFCFDASFPESTSQQEVYSTTTVDLVEGVLQGRNGSVFCYGATGAGKTYTMLGTIEKPGVMVLAIKDLFSKIRQRSFDGNHSVLLSYLEVYNETVRDLISPGRPLVLREDKQGIIAAGLTQYRAYSTDEVMQLLQQGNQNRTTEPTRVNETSSRSHAILQVVAEYQVRESVNVVTKIGKLSLIDLAGSERALATDLRTQRSIEGANINKSLLSLSSCINALVEGKKHIPYRNSKLTQLLKDSLGGPCNTVMIANISPSILCFSETQNTLHWADRAKEIRNKACLPTEETIKIPESETDQTKLLLELQKQNSELRQQAVRFQQKLLSSQAHILTSTSIQKAPAAPSFPLFSSPCSPNQKSKRSILGSGNCFGTPDSIKRGASNERRTTQEFQKRVKELENEIERLNNENERLKKEHAVQLKQKDDYIHLLILKRGTKPAEGKVKCRMGKGGSLLKEDLKSPSHRFTSPQPTGKKRSFWDIGYSPSVGAANGRKIRSHVLAPQSPAPSMLLPPGFAWTKQDTASRQ